MGTPIAAALAAGSRRNLVPIRMISTPTTRRRPAPPVTKQLFWSALHGVVTLTRSGRLSPEAQGERLRLLVSHFANRSA
jgi:hypothetical protein